MGGGAHAGCLPAGSAGSAAYPQDDHGGQVGDAGQRPTPGPVHQPLLNPIFILNHAQLRRVLDAYLIHYNGHRPHRTLGQRPPNHRGSVAPPVQGLVRRRRILSGLVNEYYRAA